MGTLPKFGMTNALALVALSAGTALGQGMRFPTGDAKTRVKVHEVEAPPMDETSQERRRWLAGVERELRKLNAEYFRSIRNTQIRQVGISKLRDYNDPAVWPTMLDVFEDAKHDVKTALLDMFYDHASDEGDATLAWIAVFDDEEFFRTAAAARLEKRIASMDGEPSSRIRSVVAHALKSNENQVLTNAAKLANRLSIVEAIPALISAQAQPTGRAADGGDGALAYILVGQQVSFVSDLTPVIGDSAVAFDPTVAVATDGVVLSVSDAVVITYRVEVHNALVGLSSRAWGQSTKDLGYDPGAWKQWYEEEFLPHLARQRELAAKDDDADNGPG